MTFAHVYNETEKNIGYASDKLSAVRMSMEKVLSLVINLIWYQKHSNFFCINVQCRTVSNALEKCKAKICTYGLVENSK